jgi:hypothetical protein
MQGRHEFMHEAEYRSLEFFQLHTSLCFGKDIGAYILQAAYHEPIIRTIAVAIGVLHNSFVFNHKGISTTREETHFTLLHYRKTIRQLIAMNPKTSPQSNDTFLVACMLFFCFECLQGNYRLAIQHANSGLKIIKQHQNLATSQSFPRYIPQDAVTLLFAILENQILEIEAQYLSRQTCNQQSSSHLRPLSPILITFHLPQMKCAFVLSFFTTDLYVFKLYARC